MLGVSEIDLARIFVGTLSVLAASLIFFFAYDIGRDGEWREYWPAVVAEAMLGSLALFLGAAFVFGHG